MGMGDKFKTDLDPCAANHQPLTPLHFLVRAAETYPDRTAAIYGNRRYSWRQHAERCRRLAGALIAQGIGRGDTVAIFAPNSLAMLEAQFGVPMAGAVLCCLNSRLDAAAVAFILDHSEAKLLFVDRQFAAIAREALGTLATPPLVVDIDDPDAEDNGTAGTIEYEAFLAGGDPGTAIRWPDSEWDAIALNYTSGTTGDPKGVVYHHRGAYLNALGQVVNAQMPGQTPVYLWTLPLFHCNGWCFPWALAAVGATQVCIRKVNAEVIYDAIQRHGVTLFCCAPTVLGFLIDGCPAGWQPPERRIRVMAGGASPPGPILRKLGELGFEPVHLYGMTEMHGVATVCEPQEGWADLSSEDRLKRLGWQGVRAVVLNEMIVADPQSLEPVPRDGRVMGEILMRGNLTMKGYLKNPKATAAAFADGWFHTGDLAVVHENGYIEVKDRSKDVIISGGENISSTEIEEVLYGHPAVLGVAVVAVPDRRWGETPCAIVDLRPGMAGTVSEADIIRFCRERLAGFKCPRHVLFETLVRTATGKLQKFKLRTLATERLTDANRL